MAPKIIPPEPRTCARCGKPITAPRRYKYCSVACAEAAEKERRREYSGAPKGGVYRWFTCPDCGAEVYRPIKCKRCAACQDKLNKQRNALRRKHGAERPLGSTDTCQRCGKPYIVESGLQRYCKACAEIAMQENIRAHKRAYNATLRADPEKNEEIKARKRVVPEQPVCLRCGKPVEHCRQKYCPECALIMRRSDIRAYAARKRQEKKEGENKHDENAEN